MTDKQNKERKKEVREEKKKEGCGERLCVQPEAQGSDRLFLLLCKQPTSLYRSISSRRGHKGL